MAARLPDDEAERLAVLYGHHILDTPPEEEFNDLVRLAAQVCGSPIAAVTLIDEHRQWFKAITGLDATETPRDVAFCAHTILQSDPLIIPDVLADPRFRDNPLVTGDPHIRFYAGVPLVTEDGHALGSLCVIDRAPRTLTADQMATLRLLARQVASQMKTARRTAERRRTEVVLEAQREFNRALLESLQEGIVACDADGTLTLFNRATREFHGLPEQPLPPEQWAEHFDLYEKDGMTPLRTADIPLFRALRGETVRDAEMVIAPKSGPARTLLASGQAIFGADGRKLGAVVAMHDVTERRQAERDLARLAGIVESSQEAILATTLDGTIVSWNQGAVRLYGYAASEVIGRHVSFLTPAGEDSPFSVVVTLLQRGEAVETLEVSCARRNGAEFQAALSFSPFRSPTGEIVGVSVVASDITDRKRAEAALAASHAALAESEAALRAVLEGAPVILYGTDANGTVTLSEGTGLAALGLKPGELVGRSVFEFSAGNPESEAYTRRALAGESVSYDAHYGGLWLHTELRPAQGADGRAAGLIGVCYDVTERVVSEERFRVLFEDSSDAHLLLGEGGTIDCNAAAVAMLGCTDKAQVLSLHPAVMSPEFQPDGRRSKDKRVEMDALAHEKGFHRFEWNLKGRSGVEFPAEVTLTPVTLAGRPVLLSVMHDLTERKRREKLIQDHAVILEFQKGQLEATNAELARANAELAALATTDGLTGLRNHRAFQERLAEESERAGRYAPPLSLIMLDVDHFKLYNDAHGHPAGDVVLKTVAHILQVCSRTTDIVARYGGEEFVLILPQTDRDGAEVFAERVRAAVEGHRWPVRAITVSLGAACLRLREESGADLISRADKAMYQSKLAGRNRVTCAE